MVYNCQLCDTVLDDAYNTAEYVVIKGNERESCPDWLDEEIIEE